MNFFFCQILKLYCVTIWIKKKWKNIQCSDCIRAKTIHLWSFLHPERVAERKWVNESEGERASIFSCCLFSIFVNNFMAQEGNSRFISSTLPLKFEHVFLSQLSRFLISSLSLFSVSTLFLYEESKRREQNLRQNHLREDNEASNERMSEWKDSRISFKTKTITWHDAVIYTRKLSR